jgi:hypothetical protein
VGESPTEEEAFDLRKRAEELRPQVEASSKEPLFVEFAGSPKSGKSTCIEVVRHFFRRTGYRILAPTEGASKRTPFYLRDDLVSFNAWSACYAISNVLEAMHHSDRYAVALLDRGIFDALAWFELLHADRQLSDSDQQSINSFLMLDKWRAQIGLVVLLTADADTSMKRENVDKLIFEAGRAMNPDFLGRLREAYGVIENRYASTFPKVEVIDTSDKAQVRLKEVSYRVTSVILDLLEERLK